MKDRTGYKKCVSCRCYRLEETYISKFGLILKTCCKCRQGGIKYYKYDKIDRTGFIRCPRCTCFRTPDDFKDDQRDYKSCCKCRIISRTHMAKKKQI